LDQRESYIENKYTIDAELAGHTHTLDVKLQSLGGTGFSVCCAHAC